MGGTGRVCANGGAARTKRSAGGAQPRGIIPNMHNGDDGLPLCEEPCEEVVDEDRMHELLEEFCARHCRYHAPGAGIGERFGRAVERGAPEA
jgi:hypothetical protein